jgi:hypothetical protein
LLLGGAGGGEGGEGGEVWCVMYERNLATPHPHPHHLREGGGRRF